MNMEGAHYGTTLASLLPIAPLLGILIVAPGSGSVSGALAESETIAPLAAAVAGFALGNAVQWWYTGTVWQVLVFPFYAATIFTTWRLETLADSPDTCSALCYAHYVSFVALALAEFGTLYWFVRVSPVIVVLAAGILVATGVLYGLEIGSSDFDLTDEQTTTRLRAVGFVEVLYFCIARTLGASNALSDARYQLAP